MSNYPRPPQPALFQARSLTDEEKRESCAKGGMFFGILSFFAPFGFIYGIFLPIIATVLSCRGLQSKARKQAKIGLICVGSATALWVIVLGIYFAFISR
jgi:hypothetical protein